MNKQELRKKYLEIRKLVTDKEIKSKKIKTNIMNLQVYKYAKVIALYKNMLHEVSTKDLIDESLNQNKIVVLPRVIDELGNMEFLKINKFDSYEKSKFGVEEPKYNKDNIVSSQKVDLVIVPGISFDKEFNRLGFGKGCYDRFLNSNNCPCIGVCFNDQLLKNELLPIDSYDKAMDYLVTEEKVYKRSK